MEKGKEKPSHREAPPQLERDATLKGDFPFLSPNNPKPQARIPTQGRIGQGGDFSF